MYLINGCFDILLLLNKANPQNYKNLLNDSIINRLLVHLLTEISYNFQFNCDIPLTNHQLDRLRKIKVFLKKLSSKSTSFKKKILLLLESRKEVKLLIQIAEPVIRKNALQQI
jgi:hypothetical protein